VARRVAAEARRCTAPDRPRDTAAVKRVLSIAGSDSGAGAGVQADLKALARCGVYGMTAITAVTAQNTLGVVAVHQVPPALVRAQIEAVVSDIGVDAVKVGMLGDRETVRVVAATLRELAPAVPVVLDPVLVSSSGTELLASDARAALVAELFPLASVVTPNLAEARMLAGSAARSGTGGPGGGDGGDGGDGDGDDGAGGGGRGGGDRDGGGGGDGDGGGRGGDGGGDLELARAVLALGPAAVVLTGGHREVAADLYCDREQAVEIAWERSGSAASHGSGCTHSAALAAGLALGRSPLEAARFAAALAAAAVAGGLEELGGGPGPVDALAGAEGGAGSAGSLLRP
jgi:hydroxymethylpyrimidine/phosphomethylpyrimidine kinase